LVTQEHERDPGTQAILPRHIQINLLQLISDALRDGEKHITRSVKEGLDAWIAPMSVVSTLERSATVVLNFDSVDGLNIQNPIALHILMALAKCVASLLLTKARGRCICMKESSRRAFKAISGDLLECLSQRLFVAKAYSLFREEPDRWRSDEVLQSEPSAFPERWFSIARTPFVSIVNTVWKIREIHVASFCFVVLMKCRVNYF
jgi:hypothetical protein